MNYKPLTALALGLALLLASACASGPRPYDRAAVEEANTLFERVNALFNEGQNAEALTLSNANEDVFRRAGQLETLYANVAWLSLLTRDFTGAENAARKGIAADTYPYQGSIKTNLAHALFLQGRRDEATKMYRELSNTLYNGWTYTQTLFLEWNTLEDGGILPPGQPETAALREEFAPVLEVEQAITAAVERQNEGKTEEAVEILEALQTLDEENPLLRIVLWRLGNIYYAGGSFQKAKQCWLRGKDLRATAGESL